MIRVCLHDDAPGEWRCDRSVGSERPAEAREAKLSRCLTHTCRFTHGSVAPIIPLRAQNKKRYFTHQHPDLVAIQGKIGSCSHLETFFLRLLLHSQIHFLILLHESSWSHRDTRLTGIATLVLKSAISNTLRTYIVTKSIIAA